MGIAKLAGKALSNDSGRCSAAMTSPGEKWRVISIRKRPLNVREKYQWGIDYDS